MCAATRVASDIACYASKQQPALDAKTMQRIHTAAAEMAAALSARSEVVRRGGKIRVP